MATPNGYTASAIHSAREVPEDGIRPIIRSLYMNNKVETFIPPNTPTPIGPYSHIAKAGGFICISGTPGIVPETGEFAGPDAYSQSRQILTLFESMLASVGSDFEHVLHVNVFLKNVDDFAEMNRAYAEKLGDLRPARTVIAVADLPKKGALLTMNLNAVARG